MKTNESDKTRVLLVYAETPPSFWDFKFAVRMLGLRATMPPLGLATVAAMLPAEYFEVGRIVDLNVRPLLDIDIANSDMVMISAMLVQKESVRKIIEQVKRLGKIVVVGGPYVTSYTDEVLAMGADHVILGEAELTLQPFIDDWLTHKAERVYSEQSLHDRAKVTLNREGKPSLTTSPIPRFDLLEMKYYSSMAVQFSRGCPFACEFCDVVNLFGHIPRTKSPRQVVAEIDAIWRTGWRGSIFIVDDNFIGNKVEVRKLLPEIICWQEAHEYPFPFFTEVSMNLANVEMNEILDLMVKARFEEVFVGIESTDPAVLASMNKAQNSGDLGEKVAILQRKGLNVTAGFIVGSDGDKLEALGTLFDFIERNGIVIPMPGLLTALRGTRLYRRLSAAGRLLGESVGSNTHQFAFNFTPLLDKRALVNGYIELLEKLFSSKNYFDRCRTLHKRLGIHHHGSDKVKLSGITAFVKVFGYYLFARPDFEFVKYMLEVLITSPNNFPEAVSQAVKLAHFQRITRQSVRNYRATCDGFAEI